MNYRLLVALALTALIDSTTHAEVLTVTPDQKAILISQQPNRKYYPPQRVCIERKGVSIACGKIAFSTPSYAIAKLDSSHDKIEKMDTVNPAPLGAAKPFPQKGWGDDISETELIPLYRSMTGEAIAPAEAIAETSASNATRYLVGLGMNTLNPLAVLHISHDDHISFALLPSLSKYSTSDLSSSLKGLLFTGNYFPKGTFSGLWLQSGIGLYSVKSEYRQATVDQSAYALLGTGGWRANIGSFNVGVAVGGQLFYTKRSDPIQFDLLIVSPVFFADLAFVF